MIDWSQLIDGRDHIHELYPQIWDLKLIKRPSWLVKKHLRPGMRILDVGAGDKRMEGRVKVESGPGRRVKATFYQDKKE